MPEQSYPPYEAGSIVTPRQLNRWLDINPQNGALTKVSTTVTLPTFNVASSWNGYSDIVAAFNFEAPNNISLKDGVHPANPNFVLCVSYRIGSAVTRYIVWDAVGSKMNQIITQYTGQPLLKNFRFEIWNTSQGAVSSASEITFTTSKMGSVDYRYGNDVALTKDKGEVDIFTTGLTVPDPIPNSASVTNCAFNYNATQNVVVASNLVNSWTDVVNAVVLTRDANPVHYNNVHPKYVYGQLGSLFNNTAAGNIKSFYVLFQVPQYNNVGIFHFSSGGNIQSNFSTVTANSIQFDPGGFDDVLGPITLVAGIWYVAEIIVNTLSNNTLNIYDATTLSLLHTVSSANAGFDRSAFDSIYLFGGVGPTNIGGLVAYSTITTITDNRAVAYLSSLVRGTYALPLTFPTTAVSTTN